LMSSLFFTAPKYLCTLYTKNAGNYKDPEISKPFWKVRKMLSDSGQTIGAGGLQGGQSRGTLAQIMQAKANAPKGIIRPGSVPIPRAGIHPKGRLTAYKKGGSVTGIAKRGFGRALMKGKK